MLRIPHCLDNRLTDGSKVVSLTHPSLGIKPATFWFVRKKKVKVQEVWGGRIGDEGDKKNVTDALVALSPKFVLISDSDPWNRLTKEL
jgi:hypothetical protein